LSVLGVAGLLQQIKQVSETGKPVEYTVENHSVMFDAKWLKLQFVRADRGLALTVRDISIRYQSQQQLKDSEARFRRLVDGLNRDFVYSMTPEGDISFVSTSVTKILGYEVNDFKLNAQNYLHCVPDNIRDIRSLQTKRLRTESYLLTYKSASGSLVSIECSDSPVFDENGELVAIEGIGRDVTQDLIMKEKIFHQANHDPLTGLLNRYAFDSQLDKIIASLLDKHVSATLCYIDMDKFKLINDTCGHQAGDELLKNIATLLQQSLSKEDVLARVGGDEFCMILLDVSIQQAECKIQSLLDTVAAFRFMWQERVFHIGASVGIVQMGEKNISATELIKAADNACYKAKDNGRNQYVVHDNVQSDIVFRNEELALLEKVQIALDQDSFELYFQTIQPLCKQSHNISYEILLRMFDEDKQMVSPGVFIPVAERHGLMSRIDEWVFQHTLDLLEAHPIHVASLDKCSINLSGASLNSPTLMKKLLHRLKQTSVPKEKLCFEITETSAVTNLVKASHVIDEIRALGCAFSLDDFGAGMCSFTYLKHMNVDYVKIDGSFVKNMVNVPCDLATVKAFMKLPIAWAKRP
ncbi:MAG: EAL domain-containing protein, partial [Paraglaciecola sp.]|nr:EAL domain-containing protein [Paraglaciecola sp.]